MYSAMYFEETKPMYKVLNQAIKNITQLDQGFYDSIFTDEFEELESDDKDMVIGVIMGDYGFAGLKDFIDTCLSEKMSK